MLGFGHRVAAIDSTATAEEISSETEGAPVVMEMGRLVFMGEDVQTEVEGGR